MWNISLRLKEKFLLHQIKIWGLAFQNKDALFLLKEVFFVYIPGMTVDLQEADRVLYTMENFIFPVDECQFVTKENKYYKILSEGFGI